MIEVTVKALRGHVFLSGEIVECSISFTHPPSPAHKVSQSNNDAFESLAWASAQIHCQCSTDVKVTKSNDSADLVSLNGTALSVCTQNAGRIEVATKPKILFCDLRLSPGQTKTYIYREKIPSDSPPSYRGQLVKYSYKITIGTQRVNSPVKLLQVPIRILPVSEAGLNDIGPICNDTTEELTPANPFLEIRQKETPFDIALQTLQNITARRNPNFYMISNTWGKVARFCLFKSAYKLGEDIIGTFDFTVATVNCAQVSVSLQCEEETFLKPGDDKSKQTRIITFSKHHEVCLGYNYTQLILPIPLHVTPTFTTQLVSLKWRLHFEFVTSTSKSLQPPGLDTCGWQAPTEIPIETMVWSLPIRLFSTTPVQVARSLQTNHKVVNNNDASDLTSTENDEFSPNLVSCTQDSVDVDVTWDWNSPCSKPKQKLIKRKFDNESPKLTLKKHPSNNQIQTFDKLKVELEALRNQLIDPNTSNETRPTAKANNSRRLFKCDLNTMDDLFNDDFDEELVLCSQKEEQKLLKDACVNQKKSSSTFQSSAANDSFDYAVGILKDDDFDMLTQVNSNKTAGGVSSCNVNTSVVKEVASCDTTKRGVSPVKCSPEKIEQKRIEARAKLQAKMFKSNSASGSSFLFCNSKMLGNNNETVTCNVVEKKIDHVSEIATTSRSPTKYTPVEIERKRIEAKAKLEAKTKQDAITSYKTSTNGVLANNSKMPAVAETISCNSNQIAGQRHNNDTNKDTTKGESPIKCSPEEIEQKRIEAKARLQAKMKLDVIERNRLEALKRLEMNKRKRLLNAPSQDLLPKKIVNRNMQSACASGITREFLKAITDFPMQHRF